MNRPAAKFGAYDWCIAYSQAQHIARRLGLTGDDANGHAIDNARHAEIACSSCRHHRAAP